MLGKKETSSHAAGSGLSLQSSLGEKFSQWRECIDCGDEFPEERWALGYRCCLFCGEDRARAERASWCVVQEYGKGNYQFVTPNAAFQTLKQTNQKQQRG